LDNKKPRLLFVGGVLVVVWLFSLSDHQTSKAAAPLGIHITMGIIGAIGLLDWYIMTGSILA
jgi:hypothetical protein